MGEKRNIIPGNKRCEICGVRELDVENSVDSMIFAQKICGIEKFLVILQPET